MPNDTILIACVVVLPLAHGFLIRRLAELTQPHRLRMADLGNDLLRGNLPKDDAAAIRFSLDHAFSPWPMLAAVFLIPIVMLWALIGVARAQEPPRLYGGKMRWEFEKLSTLSAFVANPICGLIVVAQFAVFVLIAIFFSSQEAFFRAVLKRTLHSLEAVSGWRGGRLAF